MPDSVVQDVDVGPMVRELLRKALFFKFANRYIAEHKSAGVDEEVLSAFRKFLDEEKFDYQEEPEGKVRDLRKLAETLHYGKEVIGEIDALNAGLEKERKRGFERYKDHISTELAIELMARLKGEHGRIAQSLTDDPQLAVAVGLIKEPKTYARKLSQ